MIENRQPVTPTSSPEISVVIPCYNEADAIENVVHDWSDALREMGETFEIIIINDGSTDGSGRILDKVRKDNKGLRVLHQLNLGHDVAVRRGYEMAKGRFILQIDGNGRYEPNEFQDLWARRSECRLVLGQRTHRLDGIAHRLLSGAMRRLLDWFFGTGLVDPNAPFRLMQRQTVAYCLRRVPASRTAVDLVLSIMIRQEFPNEVGEVPVPHRLRTLGLRRSGVTRLLGRAWRYLYEVTGIRFKPLTTEIRSIPRSTAGVRP